MSTTSDLVLAVATEYLGPAAITLLERQTKFHMNNLSFKDLQSAQCDELAKWVGIASAMFIEQDQATELAEKIRKIKA
ncbi:MAG TPA: hypothetical protein VN372_01085 [Methanospirillum sp.]|nr:hypothetical protein [Methanospirillum sp.]